MLLSAFILTQSGSDHTLGAWTLALRLASLEKIRLEKVESRVRKRAKAIRTCGEDEWALELDRMLLRLADPSVQFSTPSIKVPKESLKTTPFGMDNKGFYCKAGLSAWTSGAVPYGISSTPFLAKEYAKMILSFNASQIVELGCGQGKFAFHLLQELPDTISYVLCDLSEEALVKVSRAIHDRHKEKDKRITHTVWPYQSKTKGRTVFIGNYFLDSLSVDVREDDTLYPTEAVRLVARLAIEEASPEVMFIFGDKRVRRQICRSDVVHHHGGAMSLPVNFKLVACEAARRAKMHLCHYAQSGDEVFTVAAFTLATQKKYCDILHPVVHAQDIEDALSMVLSARGRSQGGLALALIKLSNLDADIFCSVCWKLPLTQEAVRLCMQCHHRRFFITNELEKRATLTMARFLYKAGAYGEAATISPCNFLRAMSLARSGQRRVPLDGIRRNKVQRVERLLQ
eukprot:g4952.t1